MPLLPADGCKQSTSAGGLVVVAGECQEGVFELRALYLDRVQALVEHEQLSQCGFGLARHNRGDLAALGGTANARNLEQRIGRNRRSAANDLDAAAPDSARRGPG